MNLNYSQEIRKIKELRKKIDDILENLPPHTTPEGQTCKEANIAVSFLNKSRKNLYGAIKKFQEAENMEEWGDSSD